MLFRRVGERRNSSFNCQKLCSCSLVVGYSSFVCRLRRPLVPNTTQGHPAAQRSVTVELLGEWVLVQSFSHSGMLFDIKCLPDLTDHTSTF